MTKSAALDYAPRGIRINAVCPGVIEVPMFTDMRDKHPVAMKQVLRDQPIGRLGRSDEIAAEMFWLCSPGAGVVLGLGRVYIELCGEVGFVLTDTVWFRRLVSSQRSHRAVGAVPQLQGSASWSPGGRREAHDSN